MTPPRRAFLDLNDATAEEPIAEAAAETEGLFGPRDRGTLKADTRRALVQLVRGPYIMRERHGNLWAALERDESVIRQELGNLFLELAIDRDSGLAFARNLETDEDVPKVIRSTPLTLIDTALVLFLRDKLLRGETGRVFVGREEIDDDLGVYGTAAGVDAVGLAKRINASIDKLKNNHILLRSPEEDRFEISPVLRFVFDAAQVAAVTVELRQLIAAGGRLVEADEDEQESGAADQ
ncbi:MAG: DUF4194 domain-containing protein [Propionibacteriaceae bacterium]|jgi:hypothetical protein|nr:DUF4194 domain-containing protein [Propionibacteriaceae bacterium]